MASGLFHTPGFLLSRSHSSRSTPPITSGAGRQPSRAGSGSPECKRGDGERSRIPPPAGLGGPRPVLGSPAQDAGGLPDQVRPQAALPLDPEAVARVLVARDNETGEPVPYLREIDPPRQQSLACGD
jgi:hypothetical protein